MSVVSCKCPNCDGGMVFSPDNQQFLCEYCGTVLTMPEAEAVANQADSPAKEPQEPTQPDEFGAQGYSCPSCGAEVFTDDSTAATFCFYCHNPVILSGRLDGALRPDNVVPFAVSREQAEQKFLSWCKSKWFIRKDFYSTVQMEKLVGVYFPYWMADTDCESHMEATAQELRVWRAGDTEYTETSTYRLERAGRLRFAQMTFPGIQRPDMALADSAGPFDCGNMQDFSMPYLSGFQAEKRGIESQALEEEMRRQVGEYAQTLLRDTIHRSGVTVNSCTTNITGSQWRYLLLPVWMMTCRYGSSIYYFALNGQSGKISGRLPVSPQRLAILGAAVGVATFVLSLLIGGVALG